MFGGKKRLDMRFLLCSRLKEYSHPSSEGSMIRHSLKRRLTTPWASAQPLKFQGAGTSVDGQHLGSVLSQ